MRSRSTLGARVVDAITGAPSHGDILYSNVWGLYVTVWAHELADAHVWHAISTDDCARWVQRFEFDPRGRYEPLTDVRHSGSARSRFTVKVERWMRKLDGSGWVWIKC